VSNHPRPTGRGDTPPSARRWFLERFQAGELRVLCNHSVLTTGFDRTRRKPTWCSSLGRSSALFGTCKWSAAGCGARAMAARSAVALLKVWTTWDDSATGNHSITASASSFLKFPRPDELVSQGRTTRSFPRRACRVQHRLQRAYTRRASGKQSRRRAGRIVHGNVFPNRGASEPAVRRPDANLPV
jgi:hypothetical protein